eukprot:1022566-Lingulodinium_polyedra.AAC.1
MAMAFASIQRPTLLSSRAEKLEVRDADSDHLAGPGTAAGLGKHIAEPLVSAVTRNILVFHASGALYL